MLFLKESEREATRVTPVHGGAGSIRIRHFFKGQSQTGVNLHVWELAPGVSEGIHIHAGDDNYEETYYFVAGAGEMWIEQETVPVQAGDAVLVPPGVDHGFANTGTDTLKVVLLFGKPLTERVP